MVSILKCPHCHKSTTWEDNPFKPFCCQRCRMIDLGHWLEGDYALPDDRNVPSEEEMDQVEEEIGRKEKLKSPKVH